MVKRIVLFLLFLFLFFDSQNRVQDLLSQYQTVSVRLSEGIIGMDIYGADSSQEAEYSALFVKQNLGIPEEEVIQVTAWQWKEVVILTEPELGRTGKTAFIKVWGDMAEVLPVILKEGSFCTPEDKRGCVIDEETAYKLFGTAKVIGNQILIEEKAYIIRGVVEAALPAAMIIENGRTNGFKQLEIRCDNPLTEFTSSEGFAVIESPFYTDLIKRLLHLPVWILLIWIFFMGLQKEKIVIKEKKKKIGLSLGAGLFIGVLLIGISVKQGWFYFPMVWPERYIPSRWSDFNFWERRWRDLISLRQQLLYLHPCPKDVMFRERIRFLLWELLGEIFLLAGLIKIEQKTENSSKISLDR